MPFNQILLYRYAGKILNEAQYYWNHNEKNVKESTYM